MVPSGKICTKERGLLLFQLYTSLTTNMRLRDIEALVEAGAVARLSTPTQPSTNPVPRPYGSSHSPRPPPHTVLQARLSTTDFLSCESATVRKYAVQVLDR